MPLPEGWSIAEPSAPQNLISAQIQQESAGNPNAVSPKGAFGLAQLMPGTARDPGFGITPLQNDTPEENLRLGRDYLNAMLKRYSGDTEAALAAYNWGPGHADKWVAGGKDPSALPAETRHYISTIMANAGQDKPAQPMFLGQGSSAPSGLPSGWSLAETPQQAEKPYQPTPWSEIADDAMNAAISGGIGGLVNLAGTPGAILQAARAADKYLGTELPGQQGIENALPSGSDIEGALNKAGIDYSYTPKTGLGEIVKPVFGYGTSGAGFGAKTALKGAGQVLGTGLGAEAGKEIAGTPGEVVGALLASHGTSAPTIVGKAPKVTAADKAMSEADQVISPETAAVHRVSQEAYKAADATGVMVKGDRLAKFLTYLGADKDMQKIKLPGDTFRMAPKDLTVSEFDDMRKELVKIAIKDKDPNKRRIAGMAIDRLDRFFDSPNNVIGNGPQAKAALQEARQNWKMYRKSADLDAIMEVAKDTAGQYSVSGNENAIRTGFRQLSKKINRDKTTRNLYTHDEIRLIRQLSRGGHVRDLARGIGAVLNNRTIQGLGGAGVLGAQGVSMYQGNGIDPWSLFLGAAALGLGKGARGYSGMMAKAKAGQLQDLVRSGGKMTSQPGLPGFGEFRPLPTMGALIGLGNNQEQ